ncbi:pirin family protein [Spirosoma pollinicola]|uniref:Pirin n=1 Tax=Spirosoma pollinicola TaxID=2057025 RepID=A0A2K8YWE4_9BACT|nr:pirin family protein [Spirosoma pollinicola]AUD01960.1 pirin [Spirosoma pollinicola]
MDTKTQAQIYLADQRGCSEKTDFRSYHTFNFGGYMEESRQPFGSLCLLNDDMLRAGMSLTMQVEQKMDVILLPVSGGLEYGQELSNGTPVAYFLEPGQVGILSLNTGMSYTVSNPYETETINFLQIWLSNLSVHSSPTINQAGFDLTTKNTLLPLTVSSDKRLFIGQYDGRAEGEYIVGATAETQGIFVFVLQGTFEVANRLLHEKDSLALTVERGYTLAFEALSNDAILLLMDV